MFVFPDIPACMDMLRSVSAPHRAQRNEYLCPGWNNDASSSSALYIDRSGKCDVRWWMFGTARVT